MVLRESLEPEIRCLPVPHRYGDDPRYRLLECAGIRLEGILGLHHLLLRGDNGPTGAGTSAV